MGVGESESHEHTDGERVVESRDSHKRHSRLSPRLSRLEMQVGTMAKESSNDVTLTKDTPDSHQDSLA